jgi:PAS domain S-box-containing protein
MGTSLLHSNYERGTEDYKRDAEALRQGERQWREVFEHNPLMYFMVDATNTVLSVNTSGTSQLGYSADELVGQSLLNIVFEEDKEFARRQIAVCLEAHGQSNSWEVRQIRKDGAMLWARANAKALCWAGNQVITLI